jgi:acyl-CoA thioester hydrolase
MTFELTLLAGWGDMDANGHMANTAYLNKAVDVRASFLAANGYPTSELMRRGIGPVVRKDEIEYFREFRMHDEIRANLLSAGHSEDGGRSIWVNEFYRGETLAARVTSLLGWLDLKERKLVAPPEDLLAAIQRIPHAEGFTILPARGH